MQQTLQHNGRFGTGAAPKLLTNQGGSGAAPMMAGRMMAGGMTGSSLTSGLEDLKKTADNWLQDQQATHQRNEMMSSKLRQAQEQNHSLTRDKEALTQTIQELQARIKQDSYMTQQYLDKLGILNNLQQTLLAKHQDVYTMFQQGDGIKDELRGMVGQQEEVIMLMESRMGEFENKWQETEINLQQALDRNKGLEAALQDSHAACDARDNELQDVTAQLAAAQAANSEAEAKIASLTTQLSTAQASCADTNNQLQLALTDFATKTKATEEQHQAALGALQLQLSDKDQQLQTASAKDAECTAAIDEAAARILAQESDINTLNVQLAELTRALDNLTADLQQAGTKQAETGSQLAESKAQIQHLTKELTEAQQAATAAAEEAAATKAQLEQQLTELQEAQGNVSVEHAAVIEQLTTLQEQHKELLDLDTSTKGQLSALQAELETSKAAAVAELAQKSAELDSLKNKLLTERTANMRQMELSAEKMDESTNQTRKLSAEVIELKRQVESLQATNASLSTAADQNQQQAASAAAAAASADAEAHKQALQAAREQHAKLQELLTDAVSQLEKLHESRSQEQTELGRLTAALQDKEATLKQHMDKSSEEAASLAQQLEAAHAAQQALQEKHDSLEASEAKLRAHVEKLEAARLALQDKSSGVEDLQLQLTDLQEKHNALATQCEQAEAERALLSEELHEVQQRSSELEDERTQLTQQFEAERAQLAQQLEAECAQLTQQLEAVRTQLTEQLETERSQLTQQLQTERSQLTQQLETERAQLTEQLQAAQQAVDQLRKQHADLSEQLEAAQRVNKTSSPVKAAPAAATAKGAANTDAGTHPDDAFDFGADAEGLPATQAEAWAVAGAIAATQGGSDDTGTADDSDDEGNGVDLVLTQPAKLSTAAKQQRSTARQQLQQEQGKSSRQMLPGSGGKHTAKASGRSTAVAPEAPAPSHADFKTPHPRKEPEPRAKNANITASTGAAAVPGAKKRPRVAAAPERYADLVSNMTSQGGADDTDSDADDARDRHEVPRSRHTSTAAGTKVAAKAHQATTTATTSTFGRAGHKGASSKGPAAGREPTTTTTSNRQQQLAGASAAAGGVKKRPGAAAGMASQGVGATGTAAMPAPSASKGGRLAAMATSSRLTHGMHRGDAGVEVSSGSRHNTSTANPNRRRPSGTAANRSRMAPPAPKFTQDPLASQGPSTKKAKAGGGAAADLFGFI